MVRRRRHLLDEIAGLPWWIGVVTAAIVFVSLKYFLPSALSSSPVVQGLARSLSETAWLFALPFLVVAGISAVRQFSRGYLLDRQTNIDSVRALSWQELEFLVGEAFRRQGYWVEERGGSAPDGGVDLVLLKGGRKAVVQCKHWKLEQVGVRPVRELYGVMHAERADEAIFVASGDYTDDARAFADGKPIRLVDGAALIKLIQSVQSAALMPASDDAVPACPKCARTMIRRTARSGTNAGKEFWGCSAFPQCRGTRPI